MLADAILKHDAGLAALSQLHKSSGFSSASCSFTSMSYERMSKDSKAVQLLRTLFRTGKIKGTEPPKPIWKTQKEFQKHSPDAFRNRCRTIRNEMALEAGELCAPPILLPKGAKLASLTTSRAFIFFLSNQEPETPTKKILSEDALAIQELKG